jgi:SecD/SecF fusion protein
MTRKHFWLLALIVVVLGLSISSIYPPGGQDLLGEFQSRSRNRDAAFSNIVEKAQALQKENPSRAYGNIKDAVGTNDLTKYFPFINVKGQKNPSLFVLNRLQRDASGKIKLGLDLQGGTSFLIGMDTGKLSTNSDRSVALSHAVEVLRNRVDSLGVAEPTLRPSGEDRIEVQLPGLTEADKERARGLLEKPAFLEFRMVHPESDQLIAQGIMEPGYELLKEERRFKQNGKEVREIVSYLVKKGAEQGLTGKYLKRARFDREHLTNKPQVAFEFDSEGAKIFEALTREWSPKGNKKYLMAIVLDGELYSAPQINGPIPGGSGVITGNFSEREVLDLVSVLENPLESSVKIIEERNVEPSLGADNIHSGIKSAIIGTIAVAVFMLVYYMLAGVVADMALMLNIVILLGALCFIEATLTMPGIAGIVLTVGMAVDANVLIFERIREELAGGKSVRAALAAGYDKAFGTIFDSNLTTLIASVILAWMGTGPIKGFGMTLTIGVLVSMFTALVVTRLIFDFLLSKNLLKGLSMLHIVKGSNIDFLKLAKPAFALSWVLIIVGIGYGFYRGKDVLGVEFSGGIEMTMAFKQKVEVEKVRASLQKLNLGEPVVQYQKDVAGNTESLRVAVRVLDENNSKAQGRVEQQLKQEFKDAGFAVKSANSVGPTVGKEIQRTAIVSALIAMLGILIYVAFRYEFSFAVGAVIAIIHDILMTGGWFFLTHREMSASFVAAILTIIGFSINDTIVIFDRIREDLKMGVHGSFREVMNRALNQTLSRTIITSGTVFLATASLYLFGGGVINDFAFTFLVGIITGTYSSIYIASAIVLWWHKGQRPSLGSNVTMDQASGTRIPAAPARA